jgi:DNA invertase Pin-like site-specific DNA recombinase
MPEYKRVLATRERCRQFEDKLLTIARWLNTDLNMNTKLPDNVVQDVVIRLSSRIAAWEHSPIRQRERQKLQAAARRRRNRGRDYHIVRLHENGESQRHIAEHFGISRNAVRNVLRRDLPRPPAQSERTG